MQIKNQGDKKTKTRKCGVEQMVGDARFELATPWTQTKCATKLR